MRLDKYLKVSRIIKRRTLAKEVSDDGRVEVNDQVAKAGTVVKVGDKIKIRFGTRIVTYEVTALREHVRKDEASLMYKILEEEKTEREF